MFIIFHRLLLEKEISMEIFFWLKPALSVQLMFDNLFNIVFQSNQQAIGLCFGIFNLIQDKNRSLKFRNYFHELREKWVTFFISMTPIGFFWKDCCRLKRNCNRIAYFLTCIILLSFIDCCSSIVVCRRNINWKICWLNLQPMSAQLKFDYLIWKISRISLLYSSLTNKQQ